MKIVMVLRSQAGVPGAAGVPGGQIGMVQLARALTRLGADVELLVSGPRMNYLQGLDDLRATYMRWPLWLDLLIKASPKPARTIGKQLRRGQWLRQLTHLPGLAEADVIHVQGIEDASAVLTRVSGPLVVTHWGRAGRWKPSTNDPQATSPAVHGSIRLVAIGNAQADALTTAGLPPAATIPPGIDLQHFTPGDRRQARRHLGLPADTGIVLHVGRLARDKNTRTLLQAFARVPQAPRPAQLLIIGDGPLRSQLQAQAAELGIAASTTFVPFVPHETLPWYYRAADVTIVPSDVLETYCMVALEAIACGCPLIVTDQVPEIIRTFPDVATVAPFDTSAQTSLLAQAIAGGVPAVTHKAISGHGWDAVAAEYLRLYLTALRRPQHNSQRPYSHLTQAEDAT